MRILLILIFSTAVYLSFLVPAQAVRGPKMEDIYGEDLIDVPPLIRLKFQNDTGKSWSETTFDEREGFLNDWQTKKSSEVSDEEKDRKEIEKKKRQQYLTSKEKARLKRDHDRALKAKEKAKMDEKKAEEKKKRDMIKKRKDAMRQLKKEQAVRRRDNRD